MGTELAEVAPLLIPLDPACTSYEGYITSNSQGGTHPSSRWWLRISDLPPTTKAAAPPTITLETATLEVGDELAQFLTGYEGVVRDRMKDSRSVQSFLLEFKSILAHIAAQRPITRTSRPASFYSSLQQQLEELSWGSIAHLEDDLSRVTLACIDAGGRRHECTVTLPLNYPTSAPSLTADLPLPLTLRWTPGHGLIDVMRQFEGVLGQYQGLWDSLDDVDGNVWVVEPVNPTRKMSHRRLALGNHVTLQVTLDPQDPGAFPECQFMGPDRAVQPLRERLLAYRRHWKPSYSLKHNLEAAVGSLPSKGDKDGAKAEDMSTECAICYAYRLPSEAAAHDDGSTNEISTTAGAAAAIGVPMEVDGVVEEESLGAVPDINCDNPACGKPFHTRCLGEWLAADPGTRQSFGTLFGTCPYCSAPMTVKMT